MRVVSWNMNHWQQQSRADAAPAAAWEYLRSELGADVALVQEAARPTDFEPYAVVGDLAGGGGRGWGTAVVDLTGVGLDEVSEFSSPDRKSTSTLRWTTPGAAAAARVGDGPSAFVAISLYGQFVDGSSYATMLHHAADLAPLMCDRSLTARTLVAGDFNLNAQWQGADAWYNRVERHILDTLSMWDLEDALASSALPAASGCPCGQATCRHVQTYWKAGSSTPWQNDHVFATPPVAAAVRGVSVDTAAVTAHGLSDHAPIVFHLDD